MNTEQRLYARLGLSGGRSWDYRRSTDRREDSTVAGSRVRPFDLATDGSDRVIQAGSGFYVHMPGVPTHRHPTVRCPPFVQMYVNLGLATVVPRVPAVAFLPFDPSDCLGAIHRITPRAAGATSPSADCNVCHSGREHSGSSWLYSRSQSGSFDWSSTLWQLLECIKARLGRFHCPMPRD